MKTSRLPAFHGNNRRYQPQTQKTFCNMTLVFFECHFSYENRKSPTRRGLPTRARGILGLAAASCTACDFGRAGAGGETLGATPDGGGSNPTGATWCGEKIRRLADLKPPPKKNASVTRVSRILNKNWGGAKMEISSFLGYAPQSTIAQGIGH